MTLFENPAEMGRIVEPPPEGRFDDVFPQAGPVAGMAIISSKLVQRLAGAASYGPIVQGFARPISIAFRKINIIAV